VEQLVTARLWNIDDDTKLSSGDYYRKHSTHFPPCKKAKILSKIEQNCTAKVL
jgi:hypothetical protein